MKNLFILSRAWGHRPADGTLRTQVVEATYLSNLSSRFPKVSVGIVVVDAARFSFVNGYDAQLPSNVEIVALRPTLTGRAAKKLRAQLANLVAVTIAVRSATHVAVFMASLSAVWAALVAFVLRRRLLIYSGNDWPTDTALKFHKTPKPVLRVAVFLTDCLETLALRAAGKRLLNSSRLVHKCKNMPGSYERARPVSNFKASDAFVRSDTCQGRVIRIAYPAAIIPRKNHSRLLQALHQVRTRGVEAELYLAGAVESLEIRTELEQLATRLDIYQHVHFLGYLTSKEEMIGLFRGADVLVLSSLNEGFPRVVWEAMLQSLPCAVSRISNTVAELGDKNVCLMFDPHDADDMAQTIYRMVTDQALRQSLIRRARKYACAIFSESWEAQLARIVTAWE